MAIRMWSVSPTTDLAESIMTFCKDMKITAGSITGIRAINEATLRFYNPKTKQYVDKTFKAQTLIANHFNVTLSCQKANAEDVNVMMWDAGAYWQTSRWHIEGEYMRKNYAHNSFTPVNAADAFAAYRLPMKKGLTSISFLGRYDYMSNHSTGNKDAEGKLKIDDPERHRLTEGITLSLGTAKLQSGKSARASRMACAVCSILTRCASVGVGQGKLL